MTTFVDALEREKLGDRNQYDARPDMAYFTLRGEPYVGPYHSHFTSRGRRWYTGIRHSTYSEKLGRHDVPVEYSEDEREHVDNLPRLPRDPRTVDSVFAPAPSIEDIQLDPAYPPELRQITLPGRRPPFSAAPPAQAVRDDADGGAHPTPGGAPLATPAPVAATADADASGSAEGVSKNQLKKAAKEAEKARKKAERRGADPASAPAGPVADGSAVVVGGGGGLKPTISLEPPTGTRDFYPPEMRVRSWLFAHFREVARQFAFQEYDAPVLEHDELYRRKAGEEITAQMYNFTDKDGHAVTLRPEMTPSLARMVLALGGKALLPLKWTSLPQCWRYEAVQRGRKREHYQWNMDIFGERSICAELELLAAIVAFFTRVGITHEDVGLRVNSRGVLHAVLSSHGIGGEQFAPVCVIVDKLDKIGHDAVVAELVGKGIPAPVGAAIVRTLSLKSLDELRALMGGNGEAADAIAELGRLFELAQAYGIGEWLQFDASVVRGLAYYTGVVFEGFDRSGELRAICGGGRYDRLLSVYGAPSEVPACGFGFGDCVVMELLAAKGKMPQLPHTVQFVVVPFDEAMRAPALAVAARLRSAGYSVDTLLEPTKKVKAAFSYADRVGGQRVVFVAPDEWQRGCVRIKDLRGHEQRAAAEGGEGGEGADGSSKQFDVPFDGLLEKLHELGL
ncbi:hypothetical protein KFE25_007287 [Diacronema lutheri]|uniref:histidine--tRNA ligase n=2 Tax=Diacronema lutheri TaxID=2081491 RepID=A0A8J5XZF0_DIALT|nr:hypothetical protein KFE25_007287 [Diacronema lutheri]